jgi:RNA polymerase sigma factor (sigma-70 family)
LREIHRKARPPPLETPCHRVSFSITERSISLRTENVIDRVNPTAGCGVIRVMSIAWIELELTERTTWVTDEDQLAQFVTGEYPSLVAALSLVCGDRSAAEDAVQEALARAVVAQRRGTIESLPAWVRVVALNQLRNRWRSKSREQKAIQLLRDTQIASGIGSDLEQSMDLTAALAALSRRQREAVALHYRLGLSVAETAQAMRVSDGTVKTLLSRARVALGVALRDEEEHDA